MTTFYQFNGIVFVPSSWTLPDTVVGGEIGEVLSTYTPNASTFEAPFDNVLLYRNAANQLSNTLPWLAQWHSTNGFSMADAGYAVALRTGTLRWMRASHSAPIATSELLTYVVVVNGADTSLTVSLNTNSTGPALNSIDTAAVNVGDLISMRCDGLTTTRAVRMGIDFFLD